MKLNKLKMYKKLLDVVKEKGTIKFNYCVDGCHCAVGYLMDMVDNTIIPFLLEKDDNNRSIDALEDIYGESKLKALFDIFDVLELEELQIYNDDGTIDELILIIERRIAELEVLK